MSTVSTTTCDKCKRYRLQSEDWSYWTRSLPMPYQAMNDREPTSFDLCPDCTGRLLVWLTAEPVRVNL